MSVELSLVSKGLLLIGLNSYQIIVFPHPADHVLAWWRARRRGKYSRIPKIHKKDLGSALQEARVSLFTSHDPVPACFFFDAASWLIEGSGAASH